MGCPILGGASVRVDWIRREEFWSKLRDKHQHTAPPRVRLIAKQQFPNRGRSGNAWPNRLHRPNPSVESTLRQVRTRRLLGDG